MHITVYACAESLGKGEDFCLFTWIYYMIFINQLC